MKIDWDSPRTEHVCIVVAMVILFIMAIAISAFGPQPGM